MITEQLISNQIKERKLTGKKVAVLGMARSGLAAVKLLKKYGAHVFVSDSGSADNLRESLEDLKSMGIDFETGNHSKRILDSELLIVSPGVPSDLQIIRDAAERDIEIVSELEFGSWYCHAPIIAVTGTNGKTTTATLIGEMLENAGISCRVGGNIGTAFSGFAEQIDKNGVAVLEVSSFQLDYIQSFHPRVSVLLNITPDHLDRYNHDFEKYIASKCRIFANQTEMDYLIYNEDDEQTREQVRRFASLHVKTYPFSLRKETESGAFVKGGMIITRFGNLEVELLKTESVKIRGSHNLYNAMAAALAAQLIGAEKQKVVETLTTFRGVEHRLELVREINGVKYINDSKATNVESVWYAVQAFNEPLILILGGRDKGNDYAKLHQCVLKKVTMVIAIGESARKIYNEFNAIKPVIIAESMDDAVKKARMNAKAGDIVLLSPACASFDWYKNYEHRGRNFKEIVMSI